MEIENSSILVVETHTDKHSRMTNLDEMMYASPNPRMVCLLTLQQFALFHSFIKLFTCVTNPHPIHRFLESFHANSYFCADMSNHPKHIII